MSKFLGRWRVLPFEALIAALAAISGLLGLVNIGGIAKDPLDVALGIGLTSMFQVAYMVAGVCILIGLGLNKVNIEAGGLVLLISGTVVRFLAVLYVVGFNSLVGVTLVFYVLINAASVARLWTLYQGKVTVLLKVTNADLTEIE